MLGNRGDDVIAFFLIHLGHALDGQVVALSRARSEDDFLGRGADQFCDAFAGRFHTFLAGPAK